MPSEVVGRVDRAEGVEQKERSINNGVAFNN